MGRKNQRRVSIYCGQRMAGLCEGGFTGLPGSVEVGGHNAAFIASCANNAEAGWRSTKAAIALLLSMSQRMHDIETARAGFDSLEAILAEWPLETLKP